MAEKACVDGAPSDANGSDPYLDEVANAFTSLVKQELAGHIDGVASVRCMRSIASVLSEFWRYLGGITLNELSIETNFRVYSGTRPGDLFRLEGLREFVSTAKKIDIHNPNDLPALEIAGLLSNAFCKAYAEAKVASHHGDIGATTHHCVILSDYINEMLNLVQYMKMRDETDFTEYALIKTVS